MMMNGRPTPLGSASSASRATVDGAQFRGAAAFYAASVDALFASGFDP